MQSQAPIAIETCKRTKVLTNSSPRQWLTIDSYTESTPGPHLMMELSNHVNEEVLLLGYCSVVSCGIQSVSAASNVFVAASESTNVKTWLGLLSAKATSPRTYWPGPKRHMIGGGTSIPALQFRRK
eukprot:4226443-Amphidinium_carterae.1